MNCGDSSFINEIKDYSAEEIRLILSDQKDLYTPDEIEQLRRLLREKTIRASRPCSEETKEASPSGFKPSALRTIYCQNAEVPILAPLTSAASAEPFYVWIWTIRILMRRMIPKKLQKALLRSTSSLF